MCHQPVGPSTPGSCCHCLHWGICHHLLFTNCKEAKLLLREANLMTDHVKKRKWHPSNKEVDYEDQLQNPFRATVHFTAPDKLIYIWGWLHDCCSSDFRFQMNNPKSTIKQNSRSKKNMLVPQISMEIYSHSWMNKHFPVFLNTYLLICLSICPTVCNVNSL